MHDLTDFLPPQADYEPRDADPDLLAGLLASLLRSEAARRGQAFCNVALFALTIHRTYAEHPQRLPAAPRRGQAPQIVRMRHLVREYAAACGLPEHLLDEALAFSARIREVLHPPAPR